MALVFSEAGNASSELVEMRCSFCHKTKQMRDFPPSCIVYRRGACRACNARKARSKCEHPLSRKLESARVRYKRVGSMKVKDVAALYEQFGFDASNEEHLRHTWLAKVHDTQPFDANNVTLKWHARLAPIRRATKCN